MAIGELQNQHDTPIGGEDYRPPVTPDPEPTEGDILAWNDAVGAFRPIMNAGAAAMPQAPIIGGPFLAIGGQWVQQGQIVILDVASGASFVDQDPPGPGPGNAIAIDFGGFTVVQIPVTGQYSLLLSLSFERDNNGGVAFLWIYVRKNGDLAGQVELVKLDTSRQRDSRNITLVDAFNSGDELEFFLYRGLAGSNDGGLRAANNPDGFGAAPSASIRVERLELL